MVAKVKILPFVLLRTRAVMKEVYLVALLIS